MNDAGLKNDVVLCGPIMFPELKTVQRNQKMFKGKMHGINIVAWGTIAERMGAEIKRGDIVRISGVIKERRFENKCRSCNESYNTYWTSVEVYAFKKEENDG